MTTVVFGSNEARRIAAESRALSIAQPCPFCDGDATLRKERSIPDATQYQFVCEKCSAYAVEISFADDDAESLSIWSDTPFDAVQIWNSACDDEGIYTVEQR